MTSYNFSNLSHLRPHDFLPPRDTLERVLCEVLLPIVFGVIVLLGIMGNSLVAVVIITKSRMRSATNLLLLNLSFADILFVLIVPAPTAYQHVTRHWPFGDVACKVMHYMHNLSAYVTIYTLVSIAAIRYLTIVHSQRTVTIRATTYTVALMVLLWLLLILFNLPSVWAVSAHYSLPPPYESLSVVECSTVSVEAGHGYLLSFFVFAYLLPLNCIGSLSLAILRHIRKHRSRVNSHRPSQTNVPGSRRQQQARRVLISVVASFALLWLPIHVLPLVMFSFPRVESLVIGTPLHYALPALAQCLAYSNSCVNPIIYNVVSQDSRESCQGVVGCQTRHASRADACTVAPNMQATTNEPLTPDKRNARRNGASSSVELQPLNTVTTDVITSAINPEEQTEFFV